METENLDLPSVIEKISQEKNIDRSVIIEALKAAMLTAARKKYGLTADLEAVYNEETGEIDIFNFKRVVHEVQNPHNEVSFEEAKELNADVDENSIGNDLGIKIDSQDLGRIAAQAAKQVIIQRVREAERTTVYDRYKDRKNQLISGTVRRIERGNVIVDIGQVEALLGHKEQVPRENLRIGDRIHAYVVDVLEIARGPQVLLSRAHPNLVVKLFEQAVPEIHDGIVSIEAVAREPGQRTKIAVRSREATIDPVGSCVGVKGNRVQVVKQELRNEQIDIIPFEEDEAQFVCNALLPAAVTRVLVDEDNHSMQIVVPDDQLSLAIGRRGQNVRLAAQLTGWKIDIVSESKIAEEKEVAWASLSRIEGLSDFMIQTLYNHGFRKAQDVVDADVESLSQLPGFTADAATRVRNSAQDVRVLEEKELAERRFAARQYAASLLHVARQADDLTSSGAQRLALLSDATMVVLKAFEEHDITSPEDFALDDDAMRLVYAAGLSPAKVRQVRNSAVTHVAAFAVGAQLPEIVSLSDEELQEIAAFDAASGTV